MRGKKSSAASSATVSTPVVYSFEDNQSKVWSVNLEIRERAASRKLKMNDGI